jgi:NAD(P)-dependent dehydrogenase (short-subunit alcohol dehydrogenase family)
MSGVVIVTGGSRGIGAAICRMLAARGYAVGVNYAQRADAAERVVAEIRAAGGRAEALAGDVGDPVAVGALFTAADRALGPLTALVNNAGITGDVSRVDAHEPVALERIFAVNVIGTILCAREAVRRMSRGHGGQGGGIVNISSIAARTGGLPGLTAYAATKGAVESFTKGLANEVGGEGIRVNAVAPGMTATDMATEEMRALAARSGVVLGRIGEAEDIAEAVAWLLSPSASYVTGTVITVSGGR